MSDREARDFLSGHKVAHVATTDQDFIDLGEAQAFSPEVMDGECSA